jgi:hypothetical protein
MVAGVYGTSANNNDLGVLNLSRLSTYLERLLHPAYTLAGGILPALYGDAIFQLVNYSTIIAKHPLVGTIEEQQVIKRLNFRMSGVRQSIEHMYGALFNLFHLLKMPRQFRLLYDAETAYRTGVVCFFLLNCYTCFNGSACNSMFETFPPTIEEYLPLDEQLLPYNPGDNNYDFYVLNE